MSNSIGQNKSPFGRKGGGGGHLKEDEQWLLTYADTITNLMALFIMIISVSTINQAAFEQVTSKLKKEFSGKEPTKPIEQIKKQIKKLVHDKNLDTQVSVNSDKKGVVIEFASSAVFDPGSADLKPQIKPIFGQMSDELQAKDYRGYTIEVEGHTDDTPIQGGRYPSNWELSTARSTNVLRYFISKGIDPKVLAASGFADTIPKAPNRDAHGQALPDNQAKNRRVVIKVYK